MNRTRYRIVFNRARGVLMAVAEHASAQSKSPGEASGAPGEAQPAHISGAIRALALAAWLAAGSLQAVHGQIIADPTAPANQRPTVLQDGAGRPLVNIQTPSAAGVSRNTYSRFDVQSNGAVLNNVRAANPWLAGGEAKVILNEVRSTNPSYLGGAITVNGARAQVVIANPAGIKVDGASFVNASRATLTTGTPVISANGALTGLEVRQGTVEVSAKGLNVTGVSYTEILSRAASIAGRIDANAADELNVTTGAQTVDYATGQLSAGAATGARPTVAIDTVALGGMYAGKITLLATEAGTGVRNAGTLQTDATRGQLIITLDGRLENSGTMNAAVTSVATVSGDIDNSGILRAGQVLAISAGNDFKHSGTGLGQTAPATVLINAARYVVLAANARITSQLSSSTNGVTTAAGQVAVSAGRDITMNAGSMVKAAGGVQLSADGKLNATSAAITSGAGDVSMLTAQGIILNGTTVTGAKVHLETGAPFVGTSADISLTGGQIRGSQQTAVIATGHLTLSSPGSAALSSDGDVYLRAARNLTFSAGTTSTAARHYTLLAGETLSLQGVAGSTATNGSKVSLTAGGDLTLIGGALTFSGSHLAATGALTVEATKANVSMTALAHAGGSAHERVQLSAGQDLAILAYRGGISANGLLASGHKVSLLSQGLMSIRHVDNKLATGGLHALGSDITARQDLTVGSVGAPQPLVILASSLSAAGKLTLSGQGPVLLLSAVNLQPKAEGGMTTTSATTQLKGQHVAMQGGSIMLQGTQVQATAGHVSVTATQGDVEVAAAPGGTRADVSATGNAALHANGQLKLNQATIKAEGSLALTAATGGITATSTNLTAGDMLSISSRGAQTHTGGVYQGGAQSIYNETGTLAVNNSNLTTGATKSASASAFSGKLSLESGAGITVDAASGFKASTALSIVTGQGDMTIIPELFSLDRPVGLVLSEEQIGQIHDLTLIARNGDLTMAGAHGSNGLSTLERVRLSGINVTLAGNNVTLHGAEVEARQLLTVTATTGKLTLNALSYGQNEQGSYNTYWESAILRGGSARSGDWGSAVSLGGSAHISAAGNIELNGSAIDSRDQTTIKSGGHIVTSGKFNDWTYQADGIYQHKYELKSSYLGGLHRMSVEALGGSIILNATDVISSGEVRMHALGGIAFEAAQEHTLDDRTTREVKRRWYGKKKVTITTIHNESLVANPVLVMGSLVEIKAGNNVNIYASQLSASERLRIEAGDQANYYGVHDQVLHQSTTTKKSSLFGVNYSKDKDTTSRVALMGKPAELISQGKIESYSGGDQLLQGTVVESPASEYAVGVGDKPRADARIKLQALKSTVTESRIRESNYTVWQKQSGQGSTVETLVLPKFTGPGAPIFKGPVLAQIPAGDFKTQVQSLSQQPGMGYLTTLSQRTDVNWQPVKLAHEQWIYKQQGLTPAGAALLSVAVAMATGGAGAELLGLSPGTAAAAAANAAFISLSSQAAITLVNNGGDIGKTLKDLGKSDTVKATLAAALTAGVLDKIGALDSMKSLSGSAAFTDKLTLNLINAGGRALTNTAITGGSLEDALRGAILGGLVDTVHGEVAGQIKGLEANYLAHKLAHALAGCVAGAAAQGTCKDGAIGGAVGEMVADLFKNQRPGAYASDADWAAYDNKVLGYSKIVAGAVSAFSGGDAQTAITTAETAVKNNFLTFDENQLRKQAATACKEGNAQACADQKRLDSLDVSRDAKVRQVCSTEPASQECRSWRDLALLARAGYDVQAGNKANAWDFIVHGKFSDAEELRSIQGLIATTPYSHYSNSSALKSLAGIVADLTPIVGDVKAFYDAKDPFDYTIAVVGSLGPLGDAAANSLKLAKAAHNAGKATEASAHMQEAERLVQVAAGSKGRWSTGINGGLEPKMRYLLDNGHLYKTDNIGRVSEVEGDLAKTLMDRNKYQQCVTGKCGELGDQGGHLIAATLGGAGDRINLVPQAATLNNGAWKTMENEFKAALDSGKKVSIKIEVGYPPGNGTRPNVFVVTAKVGNDTRDFTFKQ